MRGNSCSHVKQGQGSAGSGMRMLLAWEGVQLHPGLAVPAGEGCRRRQRSPTDAPLMAISPLCTA